MTVNPVHDPQDDVDYTLSLTPVRKFNWKTPGARDYWDPHTAHFREHVLPVSTAHIVANDDHPLEAVLMRIGQDKIMELSSTLGELGLRFSALDKLTTGGHSIFDAYPNILDMGGQDKENVVIANSKDSSVEFAEAATARPQDEEAIRTAAEYLGYPDCCIDAHLENAKRGNADPVYQIACNTDSAVARDDSREDIQIHFPDPLLNVLWRYNGWRFIHHLPCSFDCEASSEMAQLHYETLVDNGFETEAEYVLSWLDLPMAWSGYHGLVNMRNAYGIGSYTTDDYWSKKTLVWQYEHQPKPNFEPNHNTTALEPLDPEATQL